MRTLIIDDEKKAREGIKIMLNNDNDVELVGEARDGEEAIQKILSVKPDLIFLDIQMPGINGFDVLGSIPEEDWPIVIFSTAYDNYALKAFEVQALDYLLKPYSKTRFQKSLAYAKTNYAAKKDRTLDDKLKSLLEDYQKNQIEDEVIFRKEDSQARLIVKSNGKVHFLNLQNIFWIEGLDSYIKIHLDDRVHIVKSSLKSIESKHKTFIRIHKSHLINSNRIKYLEPYFNGDFFVTLENDLKIRGSRNYKKNLPETL